MPEAVATGSKALDELCINTVRVLAMEAVQRANSGHPGTPMALAPIGYVLWTGHLRHNPADPSWPGRDRFVLSAGHASMLLYSLLHLTGYDVSLEEIKNFRQWGSITPGHPERDITPGVETTTGPLGQGLGNAVGMALAEARIEAEFGREGFDLFRHKTYFIAGDGDLMEGVSHEAASIAGYLGLGQLIGFYDDNRITIDGSTTLSFGDDTAARFEAYGWHVQRLEDGNDLAAVARAIEAAKVSELPSLIIVRTHIAYGSPNKQDTSAAHGAPLGEEEIALTKEALGWDYSQPFTVPEEALAQWRKCLERGARLQDEWERVFAAYAEKYPELAREFERRQQGELPDGWETALPEFGADAGSMATRAASGKVLNALAAALPELLGGSADLAESNKTLIKDGEPLSRVNRGGRNIYFGVREHGMGSIINGIALHGGFIPYCATFLVFSDYMRPPIRLAAMMGLKAIYVFTHDSIGLGEDGPTHQPVEMLASLRSIPNLTVIRPADAAETAEAWRAAINRQGGPVALSLTRQGVPTLDRAKLAPASGLARGGYVLSDANGGLTEAILLATGSEVSVALDAQSELEGQGIHARVVSMPSQEIFAVQPLEYRNEVLPPEITARVAVEAAHPMSWYRWVGNRGAVIGLDRFGASAPAERLYEEFGITVQAVVERTRLVLGRL
jgi:transketolase